MSSLKNIDDRIVALHQEGKTQREVASLLGCSQQKVSTVLVGRNLGRGKGGYQWNNEHLRIIASLVDTHTSAEIAEVLGISAKNVQKKIRSYKLRGLISVESGFRRGQVKLNYFYIDGRTVRNKKPHDAHHSYRKISEEKIGRPLQNDEQVHHIDGDASNNNIRNLVVLTREQHHQVHQAFLRKLHLARKEGRVYDLQEIGREVLGSLESSGSDGTC